MSFIGISKAPDNPKEKEKWVKQMGRIQFAMWVDDKATCEHCGYTYKSVDDLMRCNPKGGFQKGTFVCSGCWKDYETAYKMEKM